MAIISHQWELPLPNEFLADHSFSEGKTRTTTYDGPDRIWLQIDANGYEAYGPLTAEDMADGRPQPLDVEEWFEVDCTVYPLICQLRGPVIDEREEERGTSEAPVPGSPVMEGFPQMKYSLPLMADDIYDGGTVRVVDGVPTVRAFTVREKLNGVDRDKTWDDIRAHRNRELENSDMSIAEDMPESMKNEWKAYRQTLRDYPATMEAAGVHPNVADMMFPQRPFHTDPATDPEPPADATEAWEPPTSFVY